MPHGAALTCPRCGHSITLAAQEPHDELVKLDVFDLVRVACDELGVPGARAIIQLADATMARLAARMPTIPAVVTVVGMRAPDIRRAIRQHREELSEARAIADAKRDAAKAERAEKNGAAR